MTDNTDHVLISKTFRLLIILSVTAHFKTRLLKTHLAWSNR